MLYSLFLFISGICSFPFLNIQKSFACHPRHHSIQLDLNTSQEIASNNIPANYGYIYILNTPSSIQPDIPINHPFSSSINGSSSSSSISSGHKSENATMILTRIDYDGDVIRLYGRPSTSNLHHFQSISTVDSIQFGIYSMDMSAHKWFQQLEARDISTTLVNKRIHGLDVELELAPVNTLKNEFIEQKGDFGATKQQLIWSGPNKLECTALLLKKPISHDAFYEIMDSSVVF